ncbi:MAG TPA: ABC transporter substrate-binding protein [Bacillota bacterium]
MTDAFGETVVIPAKPQRVVTLSLGIDEIVMALAGPERFAAISDIARSPYSNVADLAADIPDTVTADLEQVLGLQPDLLLLDGFAQPDLVAQARAAGLTIVVTDLHDTFADHLENLEFLGRVLGEEQRAGAIREMLEERAADLSQRVATARQSRQTAAPRVLHLTPSLHVPARGTTSEDIITRAGGVNAATEAGLEGWQQVSLETIAQLAPDVIIHDEFDADRLRAEILEHPGLVDVPAIRDGRVYEIPSRYLTTLSFWNLRGAEELARHLWPEAFEGVVFADFSFTFE